MLAGAVALAAGRFQPLVRLEPIVGDPGPGSKSGPRPKRFADRLSLDEARAFARKVEGLAAAVAGPHGGLGDSCDFLTLAGDWPYAYRNDVEDGQARGEHALDDLIGRVLDGSEPGLARRGRAGRSPGRLLGDPAASVYRAMCSLFLEPEPAVLWNTYRGGQFWSDYGMRDAAQLLGRLWPALGRPGPPCRRRGRPGGLAPGLRPGQPVRLGHGQLVGRPPAVLDRGGTGPPGRPAPWAGRRPSP